MATTLNIKNMVCNRCIRVVKEELSAIGLQVEAVELGSATVSNPEDSIDLDKVRETLKSNGFELLDDRKTQLIEKIKNLVIDVIHQHKQVDLNINWSHYIHEKTGVDYQYLSSLFSSTQGVTIEKYIISQKIEKVKELLIYNELTLSEIAWQLGYSSVAHLSSQFKKVIGLTPTEFKSLHEKERTPLDKL